MGFFRRFSRSFETVELCAYLSRVIVLSLDSIARARQESIFLAALALYYALQVVIAPFMRNVMIKLYMQMLHHV